MQDKRLGATCLVGLFLDNHIYIANLGDTRAVLSRGGVAVRLSFDHKPLLPEERERIRKLGGEKQLDSCGITVSGFVMETGRVNGILAVARSLGDYYLAPLVATDPWIASYERTAEDEFAVFACDGVWDMLSDQQVVGAVANALKQKNDASYAASVIKELAYLCGSGDNISVVVVVF